MIRVAPDLPKFYASPYAASVWNYPFLLLASYRETMRLNTGQLFQKVIFVLNLCTSNTYSIQCVIILYIAGNHRKLCLFSFTSPANRFSPVRVSFGSWRIWNISSNRGLNSKRNTNAGQLKIFCAKT